MNQKAKTYLHWSIRTAGILWLAWDLPFIVMVLPTDFDYYYKAAERLAAGENLYYDTSAFFKRHGASSWYLYPPCFAAMLIPLTLFTKMEAKLIFSVVTIISFIGIDLILDRFRRIYFPAVRYMDYLIPFLVYFARPSHLVLGSLQVEGLLFFFFLLAVFCLMKNRIAWSAAFFLPGILIKLWFTPFFAAYLVSGGIRKCVYMIFGGFALVLMMMPFTGFLSHYIFVSEILPTLPRYVDAYKDNQSLMAFLKFIFDMESNMLPYNFTALLLAYFASVYCNRKELFAGNGKTLLINAGYFLSISLLCSPIAWSASHIRLLLPVVLGCCLCMDFYTKNKWFMITTFLSLFFYIYPQEIAKEIVPAFIDRFPLFYSTLFCVLSFTHHSFFTSQTSYANEK